MTVSLLIAFVIALAAANGANDNVKGAATVLGSGLLGYRTAIVLATAATAIGGGVSIYVANGLLAAFSGKGIVPQELTTALPFLLAVAAGAAIAVWIATLTGLPISTTHALLGGLVGAGLASSTDAVAWKTAATLMLLPLLLSPLIAMLSSLLLMPMLKRFGPAPVAQHEAHCACAEAPGAIASGTLAQHRGVVLGRVSDPDCAPSPQRAMLIWPALSKADLAHLLSACAVSFARGLNDTPKIAALIAAAGIGVFDASLIVVIAMSVGGLVAAQRVARTLAYRITRMDTREGLTGNLVTAALVIGASKLGLPVSTTHVSTGALFGIGVSNGSTQWGVVATILLAWAFTLPSAGLFAFIAGKAFA